MGDKTPKRPSNSPNGGFSPIILPESPAVSPQKNLTGLPRIVKDSAADLYNNIQRWNAIHIKGASLVKQIASMKADHPKDFSTGLEQHTNELYKLVQELRHYKDALLTLTNQMKASEKLRNEAGPLFISLDMKSLVNLVEEISEAYDAEFQAKEFVLENLVYSKNKDEVMFLAALWTYQYKITDKIDLKLETLLIETGHRKII